MTDLPNKISIVILNWNGKRDTLPCLESVRQIDYPHYEIIVVDNGSTDDSVSEIKSQFPDVTVLETGENLGYAGGNNFGMRYALKNSADYILLLNNDTIVDPQLLNEFVAAAQKTPDGGIFSAKIYYYSHPNRIWYAGASWDERRLGFVHDSQGDEDGGENFNSIKATDYASGCAFFVKKAVFDSIGFFDERFFLIFEETDFSYRAKKNGFGCFYVPAAKVWHKVSVSFGGEGSPLYKYFMSRNRLLWAEKNAPLRIKMRVYQQAIAQLITFMLPPRFKFRARREKAIWRWSHLVLQDYRVACKRKRSNALRLASFAGIKDYLFRRFGDCPEFVRHLKYEISK